MTLRRSHLQKTDNTRKAYLTKLNTLQPTIEETDSSGTDTSTTGQELEEHIPLERVRPPNPAGRFKAFLEEYKWAFIVLGVGLSCIGYVARGYFGVNREVGELKIKVETLTTRNSIFEETREDVVRMAVKLDQLWDDFIKKEGNQNNMSRQTQKKK